MKKIPVILDGDPGHDDAIAWVLAAARPELDILAVTTCCGNQTLEKTTYNAARIMTLIGLDAPLAAGREKPLLAEAIIAPTVHGVTGLDGPVLPEPDRQPVAEEAAELMGRLIRGCEEPVVLIPTGPLTNIAALLLLDPELKAKIRHIYLMGGGIAHGNWTPAAEFNILVDPEAADLVFRSGIPLTMAGLDVTEKALVFPGDFERIRAVGNEVARVTAEWLDFFYGFHRGLGYAGAPVHDAVAVTALVRPDLLVTRDLFVEVETGGDYCRGATIGDYYGISGKEPNVRCITDIDRQGFVDLLVDAVSRYGKGEGV
ncbi:MAG TPA: nucleoside hydrolase [Bacillota bacterium]|jgi:pyrimidine-specific ribonucleoside hydrolase|nr:pyrimidine-specific ribonucleoside hydrolase RihA [Fastidiosipila sp.]HPX93214.1 nucleoside hydrolase [Bacillota bacterium]HQB81086.1 nucleoside hydrolase [Bacillota bacterium]